MRQYIYKKNNAYTKALSKEKIESLIKNSELETDEFLFLTDTREWKRVWELDEFSKFILRPESHEIKKWFIYSKESKSQKGPFSVKEIISKLSKQEVSENSYLWSYETKEWKKLKDLEDFNKKTTIELETLENKKTNNNSKNIIIEKKEDKKESQKTNQTENLNKTDVDKTEKLEKKHKNTRIIKQTQEKKKKKVEKQETKMQKKKTNKKQKTLSFFPEILFGIILIIIAYLKAEVLNTNTIYFYVIGAIFVLFGFLLHIRRKKNKKK